MIAITIVSIALFLKFCNADLGLFGEVLKKDSYIQSDTCNLSTRDYPSSHFILPDHEFEILFNINISDALQRLNVIEEEQAKKYKVEKAVQPIYSEWNKASPHSLRIFGFDGDKEMALYSIQKSVNPSESNNFQQFILNKRKEMIVKGIKKGLDLEYLKVAIFLALLPQLFFVMIDWYSAIPLAYLMLVVLSLIMSIAFNISHNLTKILTSGKKIIRQIGLILFLITIESVELYYQDYFRSILATIVLSFFFSAWFMLRDNDRMKIRESNWEGSV